MPNGRASSSTTRARCSSRCRWRCWRSRRRSIATRSTSSSSTGGSKPIRSRRVVAAADGALCVGVTVLTGAPIHDALAVSRAVKARRPVVPGRLGRLASVALRARMPRRTLRSTSSSSARAKTRSRDRRATAAVDRRVRGTRRDGAMSSRPPRPLSDLNDFPAARLLADPRRAVLRAQGHAADRLHLLAGMPVPLRVLRRSGGVRARLDRARARTDRRRNRVSPSALRDGGARVSGRDVLHAHRSASTRSPTSSCSAIFAIDLDGDAARRSGLPHGRRCCLPRPCGRACGA